MIISFFVDNKLSRVVSVCTQSLKKRPLWRFLSKSPLNCAQERRRHGRASKLWHKIHES